MRVAAARKCFPTFGQADVQAGRGRVTLLARLDDRIFVGQIVLATGALRRTGRDREAAEGAGAGIDQQLVLVGQRCTDLTGERVVEIGLPNAGHDRLRIGLDQRVIVAVTIQQAAGGQIERVERVTARMIGDIPVIGIFTVHIEVEALFAIVAETGGQRGAIVRAIGLFGGATLDRALNALDVLLADQVDHAADRVRAIGRGGTVLQHFDAVDGAERDRVQVDIGVMAVVVEREVRRTQAVDQHHGRRDAQTAERHRRTARRETVAEAGRDRARAVRRDRTDRVLRGGDVRALERRGGQDGDRRDRAGVGIAEQRAGDDDGAALRCLALRHRRGGALLDIRILCDRGLRRFGLLGGIGRLWRHRFLRISRSSDRGQQSHRRNPKPQGTQCGIHQSHQALPCSRSGDFCRQFDTRHDLALRCGSAYGTRSYRLVKNDGPVVTECNNLKSWCSIGSITEIFG